MVSKIRYQLLEPRILLDGAAGVTFAESTADPARQNDPQTQVALLQEQRAQEQKSQERKAEERKARDPRPEIRNNLPGAFPGAAIESSEIPATDGAVPGAAIFRLEDLGAPAVLPTDLETSALVVVDTGVQGYEDLLVGLEPGTEILLIDANENGLQKLADYVDGRDDITSIHILSHGGRGEFSLGSVTLNSDNIDQHADLLSQIGAALTEQGDLLLYGCNVADGGDSDNGKHSGVEFVARIADVTGADVAASTDLTGAAGQGGDWNLEYTIGQIDGSNLALTSFNGLLNDAPVANDDTGATDQNTPLNVASDAPGSGGGAQGVTNAGLLLNDTDPNDDTLTITSVGSTASNPGTPTDGSNGGKFTIHADGSWHFNPDGDFDDLAPGETATTSIAYTVSDPSGLTDTATLTLTITGTDDAPTLTPATATLTEDTAPDEDGNLLASGTVTSSGGDTGEDSFQPQTDTKGAVGSLTIDAAGAWRYTAANSHADIQALSPTATLTDTFTVTSADTVTTTTITITITGTDDAPTLTPATATLTEDTAPDEDGNLVATGTITATGGDADEDSFQPQTDTAGAVGSLTIDAAGAWRYTAANSHEDIQALSPTATLTDTFTVTSADTVTTTTITITINAADPEPTTPDNPDPDDNPGPPATQSTNDTPVAADDTGSTDQNTSLTVANDATDTLDTDGTTTNNAGLLLNDTDPNGDTLTITGINGYTNLDENGLRQSQNVAAGVATWGSNGGRFIINANGAWRFDPDGDFDDLATDATSTTSVAYTVSDGTATDTATLTVTINAADPDTSQQPDPTVPDPTATQVPATPDPDDNPGPPATQSANRAPVATSDQGAIGEDTQQLTVLLGDRGTNGVNAGLLQNDSDPDGDRLRVTRLNNTAFTALATVAGTNGGTFQVTVSGSYTFTPGTAFNDLKEGERRETSLVYTVSDGRGGTDTATLKVIVTGLNDAPTANDDTGMTRYDSKLAVADGAAGDLLLNDRDPDGDILRINEVRARTSPTSENVAGPGGDIGGTNGGTFRILVNGAWNFDPDGDFNDLQTDETRTTSVTYRVSDGTVTDTATLTITVRANRAPTAVDNTGAVYNNGMLTVADGAAGDLLLNDSDPDGDTLHIIQARTALMLVDPGKQITGSAGGTFIINANGAWSFDPGASFDDLKAGQTRTTSVNYQVWDANPVAPGYDTATLTVVVRPNLPPVAVTDIGWTNENAPINVKADATGVSRMLGTPPVMRTTNADLLLNDSDPEGDTLSITAVNGVAANVGKATPALSGGGSGGTFIIRADGSWSFDPGADFNDLARGEQRIARASYTVTDGQGNTARGFLLVTVTGLNDAPTLVADRGATTENTRLTVLDGATGTTRTLPDGKGGTITITENADLLLNDTDPDDSDTLSIAAGVINRRPSSIFRDIPGSDGGLFRIFGDGSYTFSPRNHFDDLAAGATRDTSIQYLVTDGTRYPVGSLTVTVTGVNDAPSAADDQATTLKDRVLTVADDAPGHTTTANRQLRLNADLLLNDRDPDDGDVLTVSQVAGAATNVGKATAGTGGGSFTIRANGAWSFDPGTSFNDLVGPASRTASVTYTASDGSATSTATLTVTVRGANDVLVAFDDLGGAFENTVRTVADDDPGESVSGVIINADLLFNDVDLDALSITAVNTDAANVGRATDGSGGGEFTLHANGAWSFDPGTDFDYLAARATASTSVAYTVTDTWGATDTATLLVRILGENDDPAATDDFGTALKDTVRTVADGATGTTTAINADLLLNDSDAEGATLTISAINGVAANVGRATTGSGGGSFTVSANGAWRFDPGTAFNNLAEGVTRATSVEYTVSDGVGGTDTAKLTVRVRSNTAPAPVNDQGTTDEDTILTVADGATGTRVGGGAQRANADLLLNDIDAERDFLTIIRVAGAGNKVGVATAGTGGGNFIIRANGSWEFDPGTAFNDLAVGATRTSSVTYTASDDYDGTGSATVTVTVSGVNDALTAVADVGATDDNTVLTVNDGDTGSTGTPRPNADLLLNDSDTDGDTLSISQVQSLINGVLMTVSPGTELPGLGGGRFTIAADGSYTFDPGTDFDDLAPGDTPRTSVVMPWVSDGKGSTQRTTLTVTVSGANDAPVGVDDAASTTENTSKAAGDGDTSPTSYDLLLNDTDIDDDDDSLTITGVRGLTSDGQPQDVAPGKATFGSNGGQFTLNANGSWNFLPDGDFRDLSAGATRTTSVQYTVSDGSLTDTATLIMTVTGVNSAVLARDDTGRTTENLVLTVADGATGTVRSVTDGSGTVTMITDNADLLLNEVEIDGKDVLTITQVGGDTASVGKATAGGNGGSFTISANGAWEFNPGTAFDDLKAGATETTSVAYTVTDGTVTSRATLTVTVTGVNDAPVAADDTGGTAENTVRTVADGATGTGPGGGAQRVNADLLLNDTDAESDPLTITAVGGESASVGKATAGSNGGNFTIESNGAWKFNPGTAFDDLAVGETRITSVVYTASDGSLTDTATLTVTVTGEDDVPVLTGATGMVTEDTSVDGDGNLVASGTVGISGGDAGEDKFMTTPVTGAYGSLTITAAGAWTYKALNSQADIQNLSPTATLTDTLRVTSADGVTATTVTITIRGDDDEPTLTPATGSVTEDVSVVSGNLMASGTVGATGGDEGEDRFMTTPVTGSVGSLTITADGAWTYTALNSDSKIQGLGAGETLTDTLRVTSADTVTTTTVTITINGAADTPVATDDSGTTTENTPRIVADGATGTTSGTTTGPGGGAQRANADLLLNDVDIDSDDLTITEVDGDTSSVGKATSGSDGGSFTIRANGSWEFNPGTDFDDLKAGVTKTTSVEYTASDGSLTDTATLTVTVTGTNDGLTANDDAGTTTENTDLTVADGATGTTSGTTPGPGGGAQRVNADLLLNDVDIDSDDLTITEVDGDTGSVGKATSGSDGGSFTIRANGSWEFNPGTDFDDLKAGVTKTTSVEYTASDGSLTDTATLTVTVTGANDGLTANDDAGTTTENTELTVADGATGTTSGTTNADLLLNDVDIDSDDLTITEVDGESSSVGKATSGSDGGSFTIRANGSWEFNPGTDFDDLKAGVTKTTSVEYTASDGTLTDTATLTVTVTGTNDGLTANDDAGTTTENTDLTVADGATGTMTVNRDLLLNDVDIDSDDLTITEVDGESSSVGKATSGSDGGSFTIRANGSWEFNPGTDFDDLKAGVTKTTSVEYTASDGSLTDTATLTVTVTGANDGLTANDDAGTTTENTELTVADGATGTTSGTTTGPGGGAQRVNADLLLNDVDIDSDDLTITEVDGESSSVGKATDGSDGGSFTIRANGSWEFNPGTDFDDLKAGVTKTTSVEYTASDGSLTDTATLTVTVTGANDGLTANDDAGTTTENTELTVADGATGTTSGTTTTNADLLLNDVDIDGDDLTITEVDGDTSSVGKATSGSDGGSFTIRANGSWEFNPGTDFDDLKAGVTRTTSVEYTASDGSLTDTATLTVTVTGINDGLTANDDAGTTTENTELTVADGATGTMTVNRDLLLNDVDIDGDDLTITEVDGDTSSVGKATNGSDGGSFTIRANGSWEFNPGTDFDDLKAGVTKTTSVEYTASDGSLTDTATLTVTVTGTNDGLTANDDAGTTTENTDLTVADGDTGTRVGGGAQRVNADLLLNDVDIDGDDLTITEVDGESSSVGKATDGSDGGSFTIRANGSWEFNPGTDFDDLKAGVTKTTSVEYTASDGTLTDTATLTVTVTGTNDGLTANDDAGTTTENTELTVADGATGTTSGTTTINADLLLNDVDIDSDKLTITEVDGESSSVGKATTGSGGGSFTIRADGSWDFNPGTAFDDLKAGVTRTTSVEYTASDGSLTDTATLMVTVTGANDGLTANDDAGTTTENTDLTVADGATGTTSGTTTGPGGGAQRVNADLLLNDVDIDGDDLTITEVDGDTGSVGKATDGSDGGSFTIDSKGGWTFDPNSDFDDLAAGVTRTTSVVYTASDGTLTDTATLTVTVTGTNDGLTANDDAGTTTENKMLTVADGATGTTSGTTPGPGGGAQRVNADLLLNDVDIDGDDLTITEVDGDTGSVGKATDGSDGGSFTIDSKGGWTFDPNSDFDDLAAGVTRTTSVVYTASDGTLTDTATLTVTVTGTNDGLTANDDAGTTTENKMLTVADGATGTTSGTTTTNADLLLNDVDIDGDDLTITEVDGDTGSVGKATDGSDGGSFTIDSKGGWTFDPNSDFDDLAAGVTRTTSVVYTASDGTLTDTATLTVTVTGTNDGLTANDDAGTTTENTQLTVADGATGTTSGTTPGPGGGAQRVNADLLLNDVDIDGDDLTITEVDGDTSSVGKATSGSDGGSFTIRANGSWEFNPGTDFDDLKAGVTRTTSVEYTASDGSLTDTATLTVTVTGANDGLTANDDAGTTTENTDLTVADGATGTTNADLLLNDVDIDGDDLTITEVDGDTSSVGKATAGSDGGSFTIRANGSWEFNPGTDFDDLKAGVTKTTSVEYTASDGSLTDTATLTVTVTGTNDGLTANDDAGTTTENTDLTVADGATGTTNADLLLNDVDIDGDDLTITEVDGDTSSVGKATDGSDGGSFTIRANGSWEFNPGTDFDDLKAGVTRTTSVEYTASDGSLTDTATLTVTVTGSNDGLTANDDSGTTTENTDLTVADGATGTTNADLLLNDVDIDGDDLTITEVDGDTSSVGKATNGSDGGSFTLRANGSWEFNPGTDFDDLKAGVTRTTSVEYTASDGSLTDTATLTVTVTGANDGLTANDDAGTTTENTDLTVADDATGTTSGTTKVNADLLLNDKDDDGDTLTISEVGGDTASVGKAIDGSDGGKFTIRANGSWEFNPGTDFDDLKAGVTKTTSVEYTATDGTLTDTATLTVTVTGANDGLTANDDAGTTTENTELTVADGATGTTSGTTTINADLLLNDVDIDGDDLTITEVDGDTSSVGKATNGSDGGSFTIRANGSWEFNPGTDFDDLKAGVTKTTSVEYTASDGSLTDTATLTVTVTGANDGLTANDDAGTTTENTELTVADSATGLLQNDVDIDGDDLTITEVGGKSANVGTATAGTDEDGNAGGSFTIRADGSWEFNPGTAFDDLKAGVTRTTSVEYTASDGSLTDTATLTVTVTGSNDGLTANDDSGTTTENTQLTVADGATGTMTVNRDLLLNDVDIDSDDLTITEVDGDTSSVGKATDGSDGGSFTIRANGSWEFNPGTDFDDLKAGVTKTTSVEYTASDGSLTDTATLTVTVTGSNDGLTANDDSGATTENKMFKVADGATGTTSGTTTTNADLLLNDVDIDSDDLTITEVDGESSSVGKAINGSDGGSFTIRANGSWEFNPGTDFDDLKAGVTKTTSVEYTASDGSLTDTATLTVTVTGTNDGLTANDDAGTTTENTDLTVADGATGTTNADLLLNDVDIDGDDLTITEVGGDTSSVGKATDGSDGGSFTLRANGSWEFNPGTDFDDLKAGVTKTTSVEYTASDGSLTDTATLTVTVTGANDGLTANDDAGTTTENTELTVADGATGTTSGTTTTNADLLLNDVDIDGDDLTITEVDGESSSVGKATGGSDGGSFTIRADGSWDFDPGTAFNDLAAGVTRTTSVEYTASDGTLTDTATLTVTVTGTNDGLTANDDAGTTTENKMLTVADAATGTTSGTTPGPGGGAQRVNADLLLNDVDIDGDDLTITEVGGDTSSVGKATDGSDGGSFTIRADGSWDFDPGTAFNDLAAGVTRTTSVVYTASDGTLTDTATLTVTVTGTNDGLTANDDAGTTTENKMLTVADGATGTRVGGGAQRANADLLLNDVDIDGDDLTITEVGGDTSSVGKATDGSDGGSFTIRADGSWDFDPGTAFNDLKAGVTRTTSVEYTASDGTLTDTATLTVTVTGTNDGLTANDDAGTTTENKMLTVADGATGTTNADLLLNDVDIDGDDLTITEVGGDTGSVGKATDGSDGGSFTIRADGSWDFDPGTAFNDLAAGVTRTTSVEYTASDGTLTDTATLTVTVTGTNDGLTAKDDAGTTTENAPRNVAASDKGTTNAGLLRNDIDIDGDDLTITEVGGESSSVGKATAGSGGGSFTIRADGSWDFDPGTAFNDLAAGVTRTTSVVYTASDGSLTDTATLTVTVTGSNDGLTANDDAGTTTENKMLTVADGATGTTNADLLLNDVDIDGDDLTITEVGGDTSSVGKATAGSGGGSFTIRADGSWDFDPGTAFNDLAAGVTRTTSVVYTASDGSLTDTATLTVTVTGTNDGLTANDDAGTTTENAKLTVADAATGTTSGTTTGPGGGAQRVNADLLLNDVDIDGDDLTITEVGGDTGSVGKATTGSGGGSFTIRADGSWDFDPGTAFNDLAAGVTRTTSVEYTASDGTLTDTATLTVTVTGTNDGLTANDDAGTTTENAPRNVAASDKGTTNAGLLRNDIDIDGDDLTITEVGGDTGSVGKATDGSDGGSFTIRADGSWDFDPGTAFNDLAAGVTRTTSVEYTASDGTLTDTATLTVTVTGTNDGLTANDDAGTTTENTELTVADGATGTTNADLLLNDVDIDGDDLTITEVDGESSSVGKATSGSDGGSFTIRANGSWDFDPGTAFNDLAAGVTRTTSVEYTASDGTLTDTATLTVTVTGTNDGLTANDDAGTTTENAKLTVADDATGTTSGTTPGPGGGAQRVNADLLLNDVDTDGDDLTITEVGGDTSSVGKATDGSGGGSFTIRADGSWDFDPGTAFNDLAAGVTRTTSVEYTASDGTLTDTATLTVTVTGTNDGLTANDDAGTTTENKMLTVADGATGTTNADLLLNDVDIDGDDLTITEVGGDTSSVGKATDGSDGGSFTIRADGSWDFDPGTAFNDLAAGVTRTTSVEYTASDGTLTDTATLTVTVTGTNDGLTANDDAGTTTENAKLTVADAATGTTSGTTTINADLLRNDVDIDGDDLTITEVGGDTGSVGKATAGSGGGSFTIRADGSWDFNPGTAFNDLAAGVTRTTSVVYTASDGTLTDTATLTVTVTGTNDGLTANDDAGTTTENKMLTVADGATGTTSGTTPGPGGGAQRVNADLLLNDVDIDGDDLTITEVGGDTASVGKATAGSGGGSFTIRADGSWDFDPGTAFNDLAAGVTRTTSVEYTASDGTLTDTATLTVTVTGTNDGLTANDDAGTTTENKMLTVADAATGTTSGTTPGPGGGAQRVNADLLLNDVDIDGDDLTITEVGGDTSSVGKATDGSDGGSFTIRADGSWDFDPGTAFNDLAAGVTRTTSVEYTASDGTLTDTATLTVTVTGTNDGLTANDDAGTTTENKMLTVADGATGTTNADLLLNDVDIDGDDLTITEVGGDTSSVGKATDGSDGGSFTIRADGSWDFDPGTAFNDLKAGVTRTTSVEYTASDGTLTDTATLTVTVTGTNDGLTANDDAGTTTENKMLTVADGATGTTNADLLLNDVDIDGDDLTITEVGGDTSSVGKATDGSDGGSFTIRADGSWDFDPGTAFNDLAAGVTRTTSVEYTASDGSLTDTATLTVTVTGTNDGLTANDDAGTTTENAKLTVGGR